MTVVYFGNTKNSETRRSVKEFLTDFKNLKREEGEDSQSPLIEFLDVLIRRVKEEATMSGTQEKELANGVEWDWWSTKGQPNWYIFIQLLETQPK